MNRKPVKRIAVARMIGMALIGLAASTTCFADPVGWASPSGNLPGQYCYDFGGYIPSKDSPVIGGWSPYGSDSASFQPFGVVCTALPYGGVVDPYNQANRTPYSSGTAFYMDARVPGVYWASQAYTVTYSDGSTANAWTGRAAPSCPRNSAKISVPGYIRSDGVAVGSAGLGYYSFVGGAQTVMGVRFYATSNAAAYWYQGLKEAQVCVKTDTTQ